MSWCLCGRGGPGVGPSLSGGVWCVCVFVPPVGRLLATCLPEVLVKYWFVLVCGFSRVFGVVVLVVKVFGFLVGRLRPCRW